MHRRWMQCTGAPNVPMGLASTRKIDMNFNSPTYCPSHNRQRGNYINWYYETLKNKPISESLKFTTSEGVGDINQSTLNFTKQNKNKQTGTN